MTAYYFVQEFILGVFSNAGLVALALFFLGKSYVMRELKQKKSLETRERIIGDIIGLKHHLDRVKFFWDRLIRTHVQILEGGESPSDHGDILLEELNKVSCLINEDIPILLVKIETDLSMRFRQTDKIDATFQKYKTAVEKNTQIFIDFRLSGQLKKTDEVKNLDIEEVKEAGNELIKAV